ncbi:histidine phosphatase superfamily [Hyaloraphidium curvatum]|nr:histidine phosphatase superfamily [Hyaloraphidium curvatum]
MPTAAALVMFLLLAGPCAAQPPTRIVKVLEHARHGIRAPVSDTLAFTTAPPCCSAAQFFSVWPMGPGNLTLLGGQLHQELGAYARQAYSGTTAFPDQYDPLKVYIVGDVDDARCVYSAMNQSVGLFPGAAPGVLPDYGRASLSAFFWGTRSDGAKCPFFVANTVRNEASPFYANIGASVFPQMQAVCNNSVGTPTCAGLGPIEMLQWSQSSADVAMSSFAYGSYNGTGAGNVLPGWMSDELFDALQAGSDASEYWAPNYNAENPAWPQGKQVQFGGFFQLLSLFLSSNASWAQGTGINAAYSFPTGLDPANTTFAVIVGHDTSVDLVLTALGVYQRFNYSHPPFAAALFFELHQSAANASDFFVRTQYRYQFWNKANATVVPVVPSFCPAELCPLRTFVAYMRDNLYQANLEAFKDQCGKNGTATTTAATVTATATASTSRPAGAAAFRRGWEWRIAAIAAVAAVM